MRGVVIMRGNEKGKEMPRPHKVIPIGDHTPCDDVPDFAIKTLLDIFLAEKKRSESNV